jgi:hypothetical protein
MSTIGDLIAAVEGSRMTTIGDLIAAAEGSSMTVDAYLRQDRIQTSYMHIMMGNSYSELSTAHQDSYDRLFDSLREHEAYSCVKRGDHYIRTPTREQLIREQLMREQLIDIIVTICDEAIARSRGVPERRKAFDDAAFLSACQRASGNELQGVLNLYFPKARARLLETLDNLDGYFHKPLIPEDQVIHALIHSLKSAARCTQILFPLFASLVCSICTTVATGWTCLTTARQEESRP